MTKRNRMLELRVIDALRAWAGPAAPTIRSLAKAVNHPHMLLADVVRGMQYGGILHLNSLTLTANYLVANDATEEFPAAEGPVPSPIASDSGFSGDDGAGGGVAASPPAEVEAERDTPAPPLSSGEAVVAVASPDIALPDDDAPGTVWTSALRLAAKAKGVPLKTIVAPIWANATNPASNLASMEMARRVRPDLLVRVKAALRGDPVPPKPAADGTASKRSEREAKALARQSAERERLLAAQAESAEREQQRAQSLADAVKAEAEAAGRSRRIAGTVGGGTVAGSKLSVPARPQDSFGAAFQSAWMGDGPGSAAGVLRAAWPEDLRLLERIAQAHGERPVPMLVRLIRDEARRMDLRRRDALPDGGAWWVQGGGKLVDDEFDGEGISIHG